MANETTYSDAVAIAALIDVAIMEQLRSDIVMLGLMRQVPFVKGSDSKKLRKRGSVTATTATEATDHATSQYTQSSPSTLQVQEVKVYVEISEKALLWSPLEIAEVADEGALAIIDKVEQDALGLVDGFSTGVGSTGVDLTPAVLRSALYNLRLNKVKGDYRLILHPTQHNDVQDDLLTSATATPFSHPQVDLAILNGRAPEQNGYVGTYLGVPVHETTNTESINAAADWAGAAVVAGKALAYGDGGGVKTSIDRDIKKGVTQLAINLYYDVEESEDKAGVLITSDQ